MFIDELGDLGIAGYSVLELDHVVAFLFEDEEIRSFRAEGHVSNLP